MEHVLVISVSKFCMHSSYCNRYSFFQNSVDSPPSVPVEGKNNIDLRQIFYIDKERLYLPANLITLDMDLISKL